VRFIPGFDPPGLAPDAVAGFAVPIFIVRAEVHNGALPGLPTWKTVVVGRRIALIIHDLRGRVNSGYSAFTFKGFY
jgi:hypothetical protein